MKDYRLVKEKILVVCIIWNIVISLPCTVCYFIDRMYLDEEKSMILWVILSVLLLIYAIYLRITRKLFLKKGTIYSGKVVGYIGNVGRIPTYNLYVEFEYEGNKKIIETEKFSEDPTDVLLSDKCSIFEIKGKFYPAQFAYSKNKRLEKAHIERGMTYKGKVLGYGEEYPNKKKHPNKKRYYLYIRFRHERCTEVIKSEALIQNPNNMHLSNRCKIFKTVDRVYPIFFIHSKNKKLEKIELKMKVL